MGIAGSCNLGHWNQPAIITQFPENYKPHSSGMGYGYWSIFHSYLLDGIEKNTEQMTFFPKIAAEIALPLLSLSRSNSN